MDPINYSIDAADPGQSFLKGLDSSFALKDLYAKRQQAQVDQQRKAQMGQDLAALSQNPNATAKDYASASVKYPELSEQLKRSWDMYDAGQKEGRLNLASQAYAALSSGRPEVAEKLFRDRAEAMRNSGAPEQEIAAQEMWANLIKESPEQAKHIGGLMLASNMGPEKFEATFTAVGKEQRERDLAPAEKIIKDAAAGAAVEKETLGLEESAERIRASKENTRIKAMEAALARENNDLKREELQIKIDDAKQARDTKLKERSAEAESAIGSVDTTHSLLDTILKDEDTLRAAVGKSAWRGALPGTKARTMAGLIEQVQNSIAATNLDKLKGAMSDKDIMFLKNIGTNLDRYQDEDKFISELTRIAGELGKTRGRLVERYGMEGTPAAEGEVLFEKHPKFGRMTTQRGRSMAQKAGMTFDEFRQFLEETQ